MSRFNFNVVRGWPIDFYEVFHLDRSLWDPQPPHAPDMRGLTLRAAIDRACGRGLIRRAVYSTADHFIDPEGDQDRLIPFADAVADDWEVWF